MIKFNILKNRRFPPILSCHVYQTEIKYFWTFLSKTYTSSGSHVSNESLFCICFLPFSKTRRGNWNSLPIPSHWMFQSWKVRRCFAWGLFFLADLILRNLIIPFFPESFSNLVLKIIYWWIMLNYILNQYYANIIECFYERWQQERFYYPR